MKSRLFGLLLLADKNRSQKVSQEKGVRIVASANVEKSSYSGFERFLFFVTPILFTAVLLGVLLLMFNSEWRNAALEIGNKIPVVNSLIPDPASQVETSGNTDEELTVNNAKAKVEELNALLMDRETLLKQAMDQTTGQKQQLEQLQIQIDELTKANSEKTITGEEYKSRISALANMYGKMTPNKAAPILENMTLDESALILGAMSAAERGKVLERMTPLRAADVTMKLKDAETVDNREIAALQSRVKELELKVGAESDTLDTAELNQTFSSMQAAKAANLLLQMAVTNQSKVLRILGVLDDAARSDILSSMSDQDKKTTAMLVGKIIPLNP
ncbi:MotE family protein [Cohnella sp.]|uniref:MotE family protein n=1 Tax=Cohnella sp. TaxID=1883426 RepID=UPI003562F142